MSYLCYLCLLCIVLSNTYWLYEYHGECPIRSKNNLSFASTSVHSRFFYVVRVAHCFSLLCCTIVCHYVLSSLWGWCLLPFPQKLMFDSSLPPVLCRRSHGLCTLFVFVCVLWVRHISYCIFGLFFNWITPLSPKLLIRITVATIEIWLYLEFFVGHYF